VQLGRGGALARGGGSPWIIIIFFIEVVLHQRDYDLSSIYKLEQYLYIYIYIYIYFDQYVEETT